MLVPTRTPSGKAAQAKGYRRIQTGTWRSRATRPHLPPRPYIRSASAGSWRVKVERSEPALARVCLDAAASCPPHAADQGRGGL